MGDAFSVPFILSCQNKINKNEVGHKPWNSSEEAINPSSNMLRILAFIPFRAFSSKIKLFRLQIWTPFFIVYSWINMLAASPGNDVAPWTHFFIVYSRINILAATPGNEVDRWSITHTTSFPISIPLINLISKSIHVYHRTDGKLLASSKFSQHWLVI